jgi:hypothetical protein
VIGAAALAVSMGFAAFAAPQVDVLPGDTVTWTNDSVRRHTVTADDDAWDSGEVVVQGTFARRFDELGTVAYHCRLHAGMAGEIVVSPALLDPPAASPAPGRPFPLSGRAALPEGAAVTIEADEGAGFAPAATASVGAGGAFSATVVPRTTTTYRAATPAGPGPARTLLVYDRTITARTGKNGIAVTVTPPSPGARVVLQLDLRDRFGWWPVERARLGGDSRARLTARVRSAQRARVVLVLPDGATVLAVSAPLELRPPSAPAGMNAPAAAAPPGHTAPPAHRHPAR